MKEQLKQKDTAFTSFADSCTAFLLAFGTPIISTIVSAADTRIGLITFAAGEGLAAGSFIAGRIMDRHIDDGLPKRPLSSVNPKTHVKVFSIENPNACF